MAINPNNELSNRNVLVVGGSGSGKTRWLSTNNAIKNCARVLLWDPEEDHRAVHCRSLSQYRSALVKCLQLGRPFRLALTVDCTPENFQRWCQLVWAALDGRFETAIVVEELADVTGTAKAAGMWGQILRKVRKYYGRLYVVTQRPQEIDKTTVAMCPYKWVGVLENAADIIAMAKNISRHPEEFAELENIPKKKLQYFFKIPGPQAAQICTFNPAVNGHNFWSAD